MSHHLAGLQPVENVGEYYFWTGAGLDDWDAAGREAPDVDAFREYLRGVLSEAVRELPELLQDRSVHDARAEVVEHLEHCARAWAEADTLGAWRVFVGVRGWRVVREAVEVDGDYSFVGWGEGLEPDGVRSLGELPVFALGRLGRRVAEWGLGIYGAHTWVCDCGAEDVSGPLRHGDQCRACGERVTGYGDVGEAL